MVIGFAALLKTSKPGFCVCCAVNSADFQPFAVHT